MILAQIVFTALLGLATFACRVSFLRRLLVTSGVFVHLAFTVLQWVSPEPCGEWLGLDEVGLLFLSVTSVLAAAGGVHASGFLKREPRGERKDAEDGFLFANAPESVFTGCFLLFLAAMTLVIASRHFGLLWIAIETTTLVSAPLIHFHRHRRSLEATWKYLLVCSIGIALALLGNFLFVAAASRTGLGEGGLLFENVLASAQAMDKLWLKTAAIFLFVGYGTKMGLAPLHTWLPDAHSEAPAPVSALLSGALLNCAFIALLRTQQVLVRAGLMRFGMDLFLALGAASLVVAAVFIVRQKSYKRMLAYSSIEHMGVLAVGVGIGGWGVFGALLHAVNHSLVKAALFMTAGNILESTGEKRISGVEGLLKRAPATAWLWIAGFFAASGAPPFGIFFSKLVILKAAFDAGAFAHAGIFLFFILFAFFGMAPLVVGMAQGTPRRGAKLDGAGVAAEHDVARNEPLSAVLPPLVLLVAALFMGIAMPARLAELLHAAALRLGGY